MVKHRIIHVSIPGDPCHWQAQRRGYLFFWVNICGNVSSAATAAREIVEDMAVLRHKRKL